MTEFEIVSTIKNYVTSQRGVTGSPLRNEQVANEVHTLRIRLISEMDKGGVFLKPFQGFTQPVEFTVPDNKIIQLPQVFVKDDGVPAITYIGGKDNKTPYRIIYGAQHAGWIGNDEDPFIAAMPTVLVEGTTFTFINSSAGDLKMIAVLDRPSDAEDFGYDSEVTRYPAPGGMIDMIIGKTAESYMRQMFRIPPQPNNQIDAPQQPRK